MIKTAIKLAILALLVNASWQLFNVYWPHYKFKDAVTTTLQFRGEKSNEQIRERILELATQFDVPVNDDNLTLVQEDTRTVVDTSYVRRIEFIPRVMKYDWPFTMHVDVFTVRMGNLNSPK